MSHFAEIDENNIVLRVLVGDNNLPDEGLDFFQTYLGGRWVKTSYNAATNGFRKNFAGIGYTYDEQLDAFIPPKPFESWALNIETCQWESPVQYPQDGNDYYWDEPTLSWKIIEGDLI